MTAFRKTVLGCGSALAVALGGSYAFAADKAASPNSAPAVDTEPGSAGKTSDRTPGDPAPDRTPNAGTKGATGTDAGKTDSGTSDRTPKEMPSGEKK